MSKKYTYKNKFVILKKTEFWLAVALLTTGLLCLIGAMMGTAASLNFPTIQLILMYTIGIFNTLNGAIRLDPNDKKDKLYEIKRKRVELSEAEKLLKKLP